MTRILSWMLLLLAGGRLFGAGLIIVGDDEFWRRVPPERPPGRIIVPPRPVPAYAPLEVSSTSAEIKIQDQFATTRVEQEFHNPNARALEGTFLFPVPKGAQLDRFTMSIDGKPVEAELLGAEKARGIYEDIVRRQLDPALLEYAGRDLFKVRIFPIEPHARKKITLSYSQMLVSDGGLFQYTLPLNTERFSAKPVRKLSVTVELAGQHALKSIYSPSHQVEIKRDGANRARVSLSAIDLKPDLDFQLFYTRDNADLGVNLLTYKPAGEDGYFLLLAAPGLEAKPGQVQPKDVIFVLDTSGSMQGAKLAQAKKALAFCVENLNDGDRFEVLRFATEVEPLFDQLRPAQEVHRQAAQKFIESLKPIGGTAIDDALRKAVALRPPENSRPFVVVFLTDGRPTVGTLDENQILENATKTKSGLTRIFCFGIGTDVNTHLLDRLAESTKAFTTYVLPEEDIEVKVSNFFTKIKEPALVSPMLRFPESVRVTKVYPQPVPDLYKGEQVLVAGRYQQAGDGAVQIEGSVNGEIRRFAYDVKFTTGSTEHEFIPRLWATRRIGYLLDEIRLRGESGELKEEVTELARRYGVVTPYTAYLIQEDEVRRQVPATRQSLPRNRDTGEIQYYRNMERSKAGDRAVADARSLSALKAAESAPSAIVSGNLEALRPARPADTLSVRRLGAGAAPEVMSQPAGAGLTEARGLEQRGRFVGGKTFFQNGERWIDSEIQKQEKARRAQVKFGSSDYFDLLRRQPQTKAWLALGRKVEFFSEGTIYEIVD